MPNFPRAPYTLRWMVATATGLAALLLATGCGGASPSAAEAPSMGAPMAAPAAAPAPPPPAAAPPSAPGAAGASYDMPASFSPDPPSPAPAAPPPAAAKAPAAPGSRGPSAAAKTAATPPPTKAPPPPPAKGAESKPPPQSPAQQQPATPVAPLLIYVGDIQMLVPDEEAIPATIDKVIDLAESLGGYLAGRKDKSVQVRIPSARFREGFTMIEKLGQVTNRSVSADDVSEQYSDLEVRLQNLRATQKRLQEFLAKSGTIQDMLTVGRELERVAGEIEAIEGKMRFLRSRAAFSLVTVGVQAKPKQAVIAKPEPPPPPLPREIALPIDWLPRVGLDVLLNLH